MGLQRSSETVGGCLVLSVSALFMVDWEIPCGQWIESHAAKPVLED